MMFSALGIRLLQIRFSATSEEGQSLNVEGAALAEARQLCSFTNEDLIYSCGRLYATKELDHLV